MKLIIFARQDFHRKKWISNLLRFFDRTCTESLYWIDGL